MSRHLSYKAEEEAVNIKTDLLPLLKETGSEFQKDEAGQLGAALAYYAMFSIFPLLLLLIALLGYVLQYLPEAVDVQSQILSTVSTNFSPDVADLLRGVLEGVKNQAGGATIIGLITLLLGASGVFGQLDMTFNKIWNVPKPTETAGIVASVVTTVRKKLFSFGMVLAVGFLLIVSMVMSGAAQVLRDSLTTVPVVGGYAGFVMGLAISLLLNTLVFALLFKYLPDTEVHWGDVWLGALVTALIWEIGKYILGWYIGRSGQSWSAYGVVGSVLVLMTWIYFSSQILFLGAEFTEVYARRHGSRAAVPGSAAAPEATGAMADHPPILPDRPAPAASGAGTGKVAVAAGAGLLVGVLGSAIAAITALVVGAFKVTSPLRRRIRP
jgi:membrane protein